MEWIYCYDGTFEGFLSAVFQSYLQKEVPGDIVSGEEMEPSLFSVRQVETDPQQAQRVLGRLQQISPYAKELTVKGFLTCAPHREFLIYRMIRQVLREGAPFLRRLSHPDLHPLLQAVRRLEGEVHLLKGFVRFSDLGGVLVGEIQPKNRVLPLLRPHFCDRNRGERLLLYDRTHREALLCQEGRWCITPLDQFTMARPDETEAQFRRLWKTFYDTIAIRERYNPKTRRTHMPMRYWGTMTEFQGEDYFTPAPRTTVEAVPGPAAPDEIPAPETPTGSGPSEPGSAP